MSAGGQQLGTVWGHGSYVAPDWAADWLHREALALQQAFAQQRYRQDYAALGTPERGAVDSLVKDELRRNTYDPATGVLALSDIRAAAVRQVAQHYAALFGTDPALDKLCVLFVLFAGFLPVGVVRL